MGFKGGSRGAYIGAEHGLGVRAQGTRRSGDPGRIRPRVLLGRGRETLPTGGTPLAARQGGGGGAGPERAGSGETGRRGTGWRGGVFWAAEREKERENGLG